MSIKNIILPTKLYGLSMVLSIIFLVGLSLSLFSCKSLKLENKNTRAVIERNNNDDDDDDDNVVQNDENGSSSSNSDNDDVCFDPDGSVDSNICEIEHYIIEELNEFRSSNSLSTLKNNKALSCAARKHSKDQAGRHMIGHWGFSGSRTSQLRNCASDNSSVSYLTAENVAMTYSSSSSKAIASEFMSMWKNSSGHRRNMLGSNSSYIGVGVVRSGSTYYATQVFGR